ncbi:MAG: stage IV sporulation protein A [Lachnospiraceae bacterium]|nr:stage IV sporulation protein A [Lachnospiraceae bacterium]
MDLYKDIENRTGGEIYIGVVGPVRTGKSTFIKKFMDLLVIPNMEDVHNRERTKDELPQSAAGKTIMTTEPKFIPKEAANVILNSNTAVKIRLIDCVGYMVDGATGHIENNEERMVKTPWFEYDIPFSKAAEIGTKKVINDHSTIGVVVTTDGSFGELTREQYEEAEERTIKELKSLNKPFIVLLNTTRPDDEQVLKLSELLMIKYGVTVMPVNCNQLKKDDINRILSAVLMEFPVSEIMFFMPGWVELLNSEHDIKSSIIKFARDVLNKGTYMKAFDEQGLRELIGDNQYISGVNISEKDLSTGVIRIQIEIAENYYYEVISQFTGQNISNEYELIMTIKGLSEKKEEFDKISAALEQVQAKGYGVVMPSKNEIVMDEPEVIKNGTKYGVKIKAEAPSIHLIKANVQTELAPIVGDEPQAKDLMEFIKSNGKDGMEGIWNTNIFGKTIEQIVTDGIRTKIDKLSDETQTKMQETLQKITNDSKGGVICIII